MIDLLFSDLSRDISMATKIYREQEGLAVASIALAKHSAANDTHTVPLSPFPKDLSGRWDLKND